MSFVRPVTFARPVTLTFDLTMMQLVTLVMGNLYSMSALSATFH